MLILGAQILLGFEFRAFFEKSFEQLPLYSQVLKFASLGLMLFAVGLLIAPTAFHRIVEQGEDTEELHRFTSKVMTWALLPFALSLGSDLFVAGQQVLGFKWGVALGFMMAASAIFFWYLLEFYRRREPKAAAPVVTTIRADDAGHTQSQEEKTIEHEAVAGASAKAVNDETLSGATDRPQPASAEARSGNDMANDESSAAGGSGGVSGNESGHKSNGTSISDKIDHVLMEARVVLPGAQALLGFQFIAVLTESFAQLPAVAQYVHLASLLMVALTIVLLMTPAAYHRIVERGEETEHFHRFASRFVVAALVPLALGLSGNVYVIFLKVTDSQVLSVVAALVTLATFWELWFGLTLYRRTQRRYAD